MMAAGMAAVKSMQLRALTPGTGMPSFPL
jgi:hypothetical protein